jgi:hypothetical protein
MAALSSPSSPTIRLAVGWKTTGDRIALYGRLRGVQESSGGGLDDDREGERLHSPDRVLEVGYGAGVHGGRGMSEVARTTAPQD